MTRGSGVTRRSQTSPARQQPAPPAPIGTFRATGGDGIYTDPLPTTGTRIALAVATNKGQTMTYEVVPSYPNDTTGVPDYVLITATGAG